ncbi:MAG: methyl-accepting chemotaxis protein [Bacteroidia bacterium]|nr:methyl-accepting chemotaxis protein [Bacteroidia bacterium]
MDTYYGGFGYPGRSRDCRLFSSQFLYKSYSKAYPSARRLADGHLGERISLPQRNEIGNLKDAFNKMAESLQRSRQALEDYSHTLEQRVEERTYEVQKAYDEIAAKNEEILQQKHNIELVVKHLENTLQELQSTQGH